MVGIAGEDDLDAQVGAQEVPSRGRAADTGLTRCSIPEPAPARPSQLPASPSAAAPLAREKLSIEDSAATRAQLIGEIQTLPAEGLQPRAIAILKAKNRLSADDAKLVEEAFTARMALREASPEVPAAGEPVPVAVDTVQIRRS
jgi:hypothetical protein